VLTLIGSLAGLFLSLLFLYIGKSFMLSDPDAVLSGEMLFQADGFLGGVLLLPIVERFVGGFGLLGLSYGNRLASH